MAKYLSFATSVFENWQADTPVFRATGEIDGRKFSAFMLIHEDLLKDKQEQEKLARKMIETMTADNVDYMFPFYQWHDARYKPRD